MTTTPPLDPPPFDPADIFRNLVGQWEKMTNEYGTQLLARPEAARAMHGATAAGLKAQEVVHEGMAKLLGGANMPTRADITEINTRLTAMEASLARIEAVVAPASSSAAAADPPKRTRKPETKP